MLSTDIEQQQDVYTVSRLNQEVKLLLEDSLPYVWVEGEISNFIAHTSGHWYFSLKDSHAQVSCALFRSSQRKLGFMAKNGMQVLLKARVSLYENRGQYQLIAEEMEERGDGKLRRAFEALKKKLESAGLFAPEHKKPLPTFPQKIGIITSPTGAAIRDILTVLKRRFSCIPIIIYPALGQGNTAAPTIVKAIETANHRQECDVLILARGGGSLEDLWPFNEEVVAHAIFNSQLPIISGIGHEVDFTIADFVADVRAPTPSAAAEILTPNCNELTLSLQRYQQTLTRQLKQAFTKVKERLIWMQKHLALQHPKRRLQEQAQRLDFLELTLAQLQNKKINTLANQLRHFDSCLHKVIPLPTIQQQNTKLRLAQQQLQNLIQKHLTKNQTNISNFAAKLHTLSPLATLQRGFAIATDTKNHIISSVQTLKTTDKINVKFADGQATCVVEEIE